MQVNNNFIAPHRLAPFPAKGKGWGEGESEPLDMRRISPKIRRRARELRQPQTPAAFAAQYQPAQTLTSVGYKN